MLISITPERLLVQIDRNLGNNRDALVTAVSEALLIQDGLQLGVERRMTEGVTIIAGEPEPDAGPPSCKVCGEPIEDGPVVVCSSCNTPHHRECWEFAGVCSIYGCGGKSGRPVNVAYEGANRERPRIDRRRGLGPCCSRSISQGGAPQ